MSDRFRVHTDGDNFASLECGRVLVEFNKDGDSPQCPRSWNWGLWYDGEYLDGTLEEASLSATVAGTIDGIGKVIGELGDMLEYIKAYGAFGREPGDVA